MSPLSQKTVYGFMIAAMFCFCVILAIEGHANFFHMIVGFALCFGLAFVILFLRWGPLVIGGTIVFILGCYGAVKLHWTDAIFGGIAGMATIMMMQIGWVAPHVKDSFDHGDYAEEQKLIHEQEKAGSEKSYAEQQREQYAKEKADKERKAKDAQ